MLNTKEVAQETGASLRQLQWWDERGILKPHAMRKGDRVYAAAQVQSIRWLVEFRKFGIPPRPAIEYMGCGAQWGYSPREILRALDMLAECGLRVR